MPWTVLTAVMRVLSVVGIPAGVAGIIHEVKAMAKLSGPED